jgi:TonB-linked SusC/RagA family outer membrane protein
MTGLFFHNIARRWPTCPVYDPNGYLLEGMEIIQMSEGGIQTEQKNYYTQQVGLVIEPIKDWHINIEGSMRTYNRNQHWNVKPVYGHDVNGQPYLHSWDGGADYAPGQSRVYDYRYTEDYFTTNIFTDYSKTINDHYFKAMAGFNAELFKNSSIYGQGDALKDTDIPYLDMASDRLRTGGGANHTAIAGFFARINYSWKDRYMVELNGRYDGSARFVGDKRWGFFPSTSLGWNIAREGFWEDWTWGAENISTLKLRASWGQLGNTATNSWYPFYLTQSTGNANSGWLINGKKQNTASMPGIVSNALTWETIESWNIGLDWNMFGNRLTGSFDWFTRYTRDMVGPAPDLPNALGTGVPQINNADMKSVGWELELGWRDHVGEVSYGVKLVLSDAVQTMTNHPNETMDIGQYYNGRKIGEIWGYTTAGLAQSQDEMDAWIANNKPSWGGNWAAGDVKYVDLNGDGKVNTGSYTVGDSGDVKIIGNNTPRYNFGINLDANWKGFDLSMFWQGTAKRDYMLSGPYFWGASGGMWQSAAFAEHMDFWRPEGHELGANYDAYFPRASFDGGKNQQTSTGYLQDASYIRLKNIQLGYSLPTSLIKKAGMSSVRVYVSADNLLTISDITGMFDPEALAGGWGDGKLYPLQKTISVGLNVNF